MLPFEYLSPASEGSLPPGISFVEGDLTKILCHAPVDALLVSAFENDYARTATSLIGALARIGVDVGALAEQKADDLRDVGRCWISAPLPVELATAVGFSQIICFESRPGEPIEVSIAAIGLALAAAVNTHRIRSVAMPLIATGDQQRSISEVVPVLLEVLTRHMRLGSALGRAVIAVHDAMSVPTVREAIRQFRSRATVLPVVNEHEVFISYQHGSVNEIDHFLSVVRSARPRTSVWMDRERLKPGHGWNSMIAGAIDGAKIFVPFYSRQYFSSMICQEELAAAHIRRRALRSEFILPVLLDDVALSSYLQVTQFKDARINNKEKLTEAAHSLAARLDARTTTFAPLRDFN